MRLRPLFIRICIFIYSCICIWDLTKGRSLVGKRDLGHFSSVTPRGNQFSASGSATHMSLWWRNCFSFCTVHFFCISLDCICICIFLVQPKSLNVINISLKTFVSGSTLDIESISSECIYIHLRGKKGTICNAFERYWAFGIEDRVIRLCWGEMWESALNQWHAWSKTNCENKHTRVHGNDWGSFFEVMGCAVRTSNVVHDIKSRLAMMIVT